MKRSIVMLFYLLHCAFCHSSRTFFCILDEKVFHSAALTILSWNSFTFCTFHDKQFPLQIGVRKNPEESNLESGEGAREWASLILTVIQISF
jgi:hypothetical protein